MTWDVDRVRLKWHTDTGRTLVVGSKVYAGRSDRRSLYADAFGIDLLDGDGVDLVHDLENPLPESLGKFAHVDCCSVLEHVRRPWVLCENIARAMLPGATILISAPFSWRPHAYPSDYWRMTPEALDVLFPGVRWLKRGYLTGGKLRARVPGFGAEYGVYVARAETVGYGVYED